MTSSPFVPSRRLQPALLVLVLALVVVAGAAWLGLSGGPSAAACATGASRMARVELVFGLSRKGRPDIGEADWRLFLDREVTPRFPDGLTVLAGDGQWRSPAGIAVREPARLLLIWVKPAGDLDARIEAVRTAWKQAHAQESVLRAQSWSCVAF